MPPLGGSANRPDLLRVRFGPRQSGRVHAIWVLLNPPGATLSRLAGRRRVVPPHVAIPVGTPTIAATAGLLARRRPGVLPLQAAVDTGHLVPERLTSGAASRVAVHPERPVVAGAEAARFRSPFTAVHLTGGALCRIVAQGCCAATLAAFDFSPIVHVAKAAGAKGSPASLNRTWRAFREEQPRWLAATRRP